MTGVDILAVEEVVTEYAYNWSSFWIAFGVILGVFIVVGIFVSIKYFEWTAIIIFSLFGLLIGGFFGAIIGIGDGIPVKYKTQYKVSISDEVLMNDFLSKYEIVNQEGKIYTVIEIE